MPCSGPRTMRKSISTRGTVGALACAALMRPTRMRIAVVHDWLISWRGGEKVLEALLELMPHAELFTLFHEPNAMPQSIERREVHTAFIDRLPYARRMHRQ